MRVILFGATGMVGQGVLRECLAAGEVDRVLTVGRSATGQGHPKLREIVHDDLADLAPIGAELAGYDACFFCLGVSSAGMREAAYRHITYDFALAAGEAMARRNPGSTFVYVSGQGTDSTEHGRTMWARVKGATENALLALPLAAYMFRPGYIQPLHGVRSRTPLYRWIYVVVAPLFPVLNAVAPAHVTTTERIGRAMIAVAAGGASKQILETRDINALAAR
jgi:uncharacterized protein YbjT (DUF2867 family)